MKILWQDLGCGAVDCLVKEVRALRGFEVQLHQMRSTAVFQHLDEPGGGIDVAGRADGKEQVALRQRMVDIVQKVRHLPEPDDMWPQRSGEIAAGAGVASGDVFRPIEHMTRAGAMHLLQLAVHIVEREAG